MAAPSPWVVETSEETFQEDVLERSHEVLVVVDFWASWCQPCRILGPILECLADEHQGKFVLVKARTETMPNVTAAFGIQAIPSVFAVRDGQVVDQFVGVLPEREARAWLARLLPTRADELRAEAQALESSDPAAAEEKYREAIGLAANDVEARIGLARTLLARGELAQSRQIVDELASSGLLNAAGERLRAEVFLREQAQQCPDAATCRAAAEAEPESLPRRLELARALAFAGNYEEALATALHVVQKDRRGLGEPARELMLHIFHLLGPDSELAGAYRRKLALALY